MTEELQLELIELGKRMFTGTKANWNSEEIAQIYTMYNKIHGTNDQDNGCGSCRRSHIHSLRNIYMALVNNKSLQ
jgi:hypothetical protein